MSLPSIFEKYYKNIENKEQGEEEELKKFCNLLIRKFLKDNNNIYVLLIKSELNDGDNDYENIEVKTTNSDEIKINSDEVNEYIDNFIEKLNGDNKTKLLNLINEIEKLYRKKYFFPPYSFVGIVGDEIIVDEKKNKITNEISRNDKSTKNIEISLDKENTDKKKNNILILIKQQKKTVTKHYKQDEKNIFEALNNSQIIDVLKKEVEKYKTQEKRDTASKNKQEKERKNNEKNIFEALNKSHKNDVFKKEVEKYGTQEKRDTAKK